MGTADADPMLADARPPHQVTVETFELARTLATNKQYRACVDDGACTAAHYSDGTCLHPAGMTFVKRAVGESFQGDAQPVVCVDREQAQAFARWAGGRLPTEAEWEYAARSAGGRRKYPWGDEEPTCERTVISDCLLSHTVPVCSKPAGDTAQGLCDMVGNAFQWVQDRYHGGYGGAPADGSAWDDSAGTWVYRGAGWYSGAPAARPADRNTNDRDFRADYLGLRPARSR